MRNRISARAANAREQARASDGKFGVQPHDKADGIELSTAGDPMAGRRSLEGVPWEEQPKAIAQWTNYRLSAFDEPELLDEGQVDVTTLLYKNPDLVERLADATGLDPAGQVDGEDAGDPDNFGDSMSGEGYEDHVVDLHGIEPGGGGFDVDLAGAYAEYVIECRKAGVVPFSDPAGAQQQGRSERYSAVRRLQDRAQRSIVEAARFRDQSWETPVQARASVARELYLEAAREEADAALDQLAVIGKRNGATYVVIPVSDDHSDGDMYSGYPEFYDGDGEMVDVENEDGYEEAYDVWSRVDRSESVAGEVSRMTAHDDATGQVLYENSYGGIIHRIG